jgi:sensor histidine kinase YesM
MNPHFLYNTLTLIGMLGMEDGNEEIFNITSELVQMLRYITYDGQELVTLKDELEHSVRYLDIMKTRYQDHLVVDIHAEGDLNKIRLPKLSLQPFVENCMKHGFTGKKYPWHIQLHVRVTQEGWSVRIQDDGDGFPREYIQQFASRKDKQGRLGVYSEGSGMGMLNTFTRLYHTFGKAMFFELSNNETGGASVFLGCEAGDIENDQDIAG